MPIHIWHAFFDLSFGIALNTVEQLIANGQIEPTSQTFQAPGGATTKKIIYKIYYHYAYSLATTTTEPQLEADYIQDRNGHILPFVRFQGGSLIIQDEALVVLDSIKGK